MLDELLPPFVATEEVFGDLNGAVLFSAEEAVISKAVQSRRREFATVRACARAALARLGVPAGPIVPGPKGAPGWPAGIVGSMTHCRGYRGSAVARVGDLVTLGVDAEEHAPLPAGVLDLVGLATERAEVRRLAATRPEVHWDRLLFSIKESVYKAWSPLTGRWLGFEEAAVSIEPVAGTFSARLLVPGPLVAGGEVHTFQGRWVARDGLVLSATALPVRRLQRPA